MQTASGNFALAVSASSGVWAPPVVHADWANDGYGGDTSIDNLSDLAGRPISIQQALDDGMPSDVTITSGRDATSKALMPVGGRTVSGTVFTGPQYWSVDNASSPLSGYDRDVAALTVSHGLVTASGIERVTLFTGQMLDVQVTGRSATLTAQSQTRLKMTKAVQPPPIVGDRLGLEATWPVSFALYQCGIYVSPPPRSGCRLWAPMHGSLQPFLPAVGRKDHGAVLKDLNLGFSTDARPEFITGPYLTGFYGSRTTARAIQLNYWSRWPVADGTDLLTTAGNAGRIEMWVRGDATDAVGSPLELAGVFISNSAYAWGGVDTNRKAFIQVNDNAGHTVTLTSTATLPTDGNWYFVGAAYDIAGKKLWTCNNFGGGNVVETSSAGTLVTTSLPATENYDPDLTAGSVTVRSCLPIAEVHLTAGAQANPDTTVWLNDSSYTATWSTGAVLRQSQLDLVALAEPKPREAWEFISQWAQAELAVTRTDELDHFCYLPLSYWTETAQQAVADTWSTALNADGNFVISRDPTKVRNEITVNYRAARLGSMVDFQRDNVYAGFTIFTLPPGTTYLTLQFGSPVASVEYIGDNPPYSTGMLMIDGTYTTPPVRNFMSANTVADGSGTYATNSQIVANVTSWDAGKAIVKVQNLTGTTYYTTNPNGLAYVSLNGTFLIVSDSAHTTVRDSTSVTARGTRGLTVDLPGVQDVDTATRVAYNLLSRSLRPRPQLKVKLRADPRRQPGDLVTFADPGNTNASGTWRSVAVDTTLNAADATQQVTATKASLTGVWGTSTWDDCVWGP